MQNYLLPGLSLSVIIFTHGILQNTQIFSIRQNFLISSIFFSDVKFHHCSIIFQ